ncbi:PilZ domain-containing protein [Marinimicrobium sp. ARAG 43.8]|uniref:PilZ domain-containing protein n=1 Tax=Marinimicrobium sp. ARAG 43.8 TaxID=3418719 RepID=UPI003CF796AE
MGVKGSGEERRDFIRVKVDSPLPAQLFGEQVQTQGMCLNLSGGGMLLSLDQALPLGQEIEVTVASKEGPSPTLRARTRVVRSEPEEEQPNRHRIGVKILEILD